MDPSPEEQIAQLRRELELMHEREALLARIEAVSRTAIDPVQITSNAVELLGRHIRVNRCAYAEVDADQDTASVIGNFVDGLPSMIGTYSLRRFSTSLHDLLVAGSPFVVDDVEADPRCADVLQSFRETSIRATISYPLMKDSHLTSILAVHTTEPRHWTEKEVNLVGTVAARCWESIERARVRRALEIDREELRRKSEESERQHAELKTIYDTAPIGLAYFDLDDYHYLRLNHRQAAFFGLTPDQVLGRTLTEMAPIPGLRELFDQVARGEPVVNYPLEGTLVTDPTEYRYWTVSYFPVYGPDAKIQGITAASLEITQQKKAEKALIQADKLAAVGRLAASIAHEINNPLEAITNLLFLARSTDNQEQLRIFLDSADAELRRVSAITAQTLRFHRQSTSPQQVDTAALVNEILNVYQGRLRNSQTQLSTRLTAQRTVRCFDGEIRQVLANFIANALDAMNSGPRKLTVRTREATRWSTGQQGVVFTVADTGSGIDKSATIRLFEPFYTTKGTIGTGLGLWVSKEIINRHHGSIFFRSSRSPRRHGTVFAFFLPFDSEIG
ncbi:sensor histidine kinase [Occallatibacter savannae]|uniref:sensor histidine kinase n=1 Tax=Occallatibacter savannae TaxID=1002691 RepID=UPI001EF62469|nr:sensor histidine kinase [Occallatibacter savannae]